MLLYKVAQKYGRGPEKLIAQCGTKEDAILLIEVKLAEDQRRKDNPDYALYEGTDLVEVYSQAHLSTATEPTDSNQGQGRSSTQSFSPTPFNTAPRPSGMPHSWLKDEPDDKKK